MNWSRSLIRFFVAAISIYIAGYIIAGFSVMTVPLIILTALIIAGLSYLVEMVMNRPISLYNHALVSFTVSLVVLIAARYLIPGAAITFLGSVILALIIGAIDLFVQNTEKTEEPHH